MRGDSVLGGLQTSVGWGGAVPHRRLPWTWPEGSAWCFGDSRQAAVVGEQREPGTPTPQEWLGHLLALSGLISLSLHFFMCKMV